MTHPSRPRRARGALAAAIAVGVLAPVLGVGTGATAAPAAAATQSLVCSSQKAGLAAKLKTDIAAALRGRSGTVAIVVNDRVTKTSCSLRLDSKFDSASIVKSTVLATLLWDAQKTRRALTTTEQRLAKDMITKSDNTATSTLWRQLGVAKVNGFLRAANMTATVPGTGGYWGLTQINARDQQKLLWHLTVKNTVLTDASRAYALKLMNGVVAAQRWGTPAGAPSGTKIHVKNGWLERATNGWRVHSIGAFNGGGRDYTITVLTHGNRTMTDGVNTIQAVAKAVHKDLNPAGAARLSAPAFVPPVAPQEATVPVPETHPVP